MSRRNRTEQTRAADRKVFLESTQDEFNVFSEAVEDTIHEMVNDKRSFEDILYYAAQKRHQWQAKIAPSHPNTEYFGRYRRNNHEDRYSMEEYANAKNPNSGEHFQNIRNLVGKLFFDSDFKTIIEFQATVITIQLNQEHTDNLLEVLKKKLEGQDKYLNSTLLVKNVSPDDQERYFIYKENTLIDFKRPYDKDTFAYELDCPKEQQFPIGMYIERFTQDLARYDRFYMLDENAPIRGNFLVTQNQSPLGKGMDIRGQFTYELDTQRLYLDQVRTIANPVHFIPQTFKELTSEIERFKATQKVDEDKQGLTKETDEKEIELNDEQAAQQYSAAITHYNQKIEQFMSPSCQGEQALKILAEIAYHLSRNMPFERGSAAIIGWIIRGIGLEKGFDFGAIKTSDLPFDMAAGMSAEKKYIQQFILSYKLEEKKYKEALKEQLNIIYKELNEATQPQPVMAVLQRLTDNGPLNKECLVQVLINYLNNNEDESKTGLHLSSEHSPKILLALAQGLNNSALGSLLWQAFPMAIKSQNTAGSTGLHIIAQEHPQLMFDLVKQTSTFSAQQDTLFQALTSTLSAKDKMGNTGLGLMAEYSPTALTQLIQQIYVPDTKLLKAMAKTLPEPNSKGQTGLELMLYYSPEALPYLIRRAQTSPEGKKVEGQQVLQVITQTLNKKTFDDWNGLQLMAKNSPEALYDFIKPINKSPEDRAKLQAITQALLQRDNPQAYTGLHMMAKHAPQALLELVKHIDASPKGMALRKNIKQALNMKGADGKTVVDLMEEYSPAQLSELKIPQPLPPNRFTMFKTVATLSSVIQEAAQESRGKRPG